MWETIQSRFAHAVTKDAVFEICKLLCTKSQLKTRFQLQKTSVFTFSFLPESTAQTRSYAHSRYPHHTDIFLQVLP